MLTVTMTDTNGITENVTGKLKNGVLQLSRKAGSEGARCSFALKDKNEPTIMSTVVVSWNDTPIYRGLVASRSIENVAFGATITIPECDDAVKRMSRILVAETYDAIPVSVVVADLITKYLPGTSLNVQSATTEFTDSFNYISLLECLRRLADTSGADWYLHPSNTLYFYNTPPVMRVAEFNNSNTIPDTVNNEIVATGLANRVWVFGQKQASATYSKQYYIGDGSTTIFPVAYEPNFTKLYVGGVLKTVVVKGNGDGSEYATVDKKAKVIECHVAPTSGAAIRIEYRPTIEIADYFEDQASVAKYGVYETIIRDRTITDKLTARQRGRAALKKINKPIQRLKWQSTNWDVYPGQRASILWFWGFTGLDTTAQITDVDITFKAHGTSWRPVATINAEVI